jgi:zinc transport system permease protein
MPDAGAADELPEGLSLDDLTLDSDDHVQPVPAPAGSVPQLSAAPPASSATPAVPHGAHEAHEGHAPTWHEFMQGWELGVYRDPVLCGGLAGLVLGVLGVFIVLRRAVFVTAAVSEGAALGVALSFFLAARVGIELPPVLGALVFALFTTSVLALPSARMRLPRESIVGFAYLAAAALAVLVGDRITQEAHDVASILFGTAVLVRPADLYFVAGVGFVVLLTIVVGYRGLLFSGFDPESARVQGLPVRGIELTFWALSACEISVATRALGALPVFAFAVLPAMAALPLFRRMRSVLLAAGCIGAGSGVLGYLFAFFFEFPVGASQAVLATAAYFVTLPLSLLRARSVRA